LTEKDSIVVSPERTSIWPSLTAAVFCTAMIIEAVFTLRGGLANGDMMVMVCPLLGAIFLGIPGSRAWWNVIRILRGKSPA
jgi:hypothetical protein